MRKLGPMILNSVLLFMLLYFSCGLQTVIWPMLFGSLATPALWLILITYTILYRQNKISLFLIYLMGLVILSFSAISVGLMLLNFLILYIVISNIKNHFYWGGVGYFSLLTLISVFIFNLSYILTSWMIEPKSSEILFWDRIGQLVFTPIFATIYYEILKKIDSWTLREDPVIQPRGLDL